MRKPEHKRKMKLSGRGVLDPSHWREKRASGALRDGEHLYIYIYICIEERRQEERIEPERVGK